MSKYKQALKAAKKEIAGLFRKRDEIEERIARLQQTIATLAMVAGHEAPLWDLMAEVNPQAAGFTEGIRNVLRLEHRFFTPTMVRDRLAVLGFDERKYPNLLPSIHTVLKRLANKGEVEVLSARKHRTTYGWKRLHLRRRRTRRLRQQAVARKKGQTE
ncbi:MAG: hypothetical protein V3S55_08710 [Nitrospiraceae bacterium]